MLFLFLFFTFVQLNPAILDPWTLCKLWLSFFSLCAYWFRRKRKVCGEANSQHGGGILAWSFFFGWWEEVRMAIKNNKLRCSIHGNFPFLLYARAKKDTFTWLRNKCAANRVYQGFESWKGCTILPCNKLLVLEVLIVAHDPQVRYEYKESSVCGFMRSICLNQSFFSWTE